MASKRRLQEDGLPPARTDRDAGERNPRDLAESLGEGTRGVRQVVVAAYIREVLGPPGEVLVDRRDLRERVRVEVGDIHPAGGCVVGDADAQGVEPGQYIELGDEQPGEAVEALRGSERDGVKPPAPPRTAVVAPNSCPAFRRNAPVSSSSSVGKGPPPTRVM